MSVFATRRRRRPEINIVSLIDVLVTLVFFFLVTMQFREKRDQDALNLTPPKIESAGKSAPGETIRVEIYRSGVWKLNGEMVAEEDVPAQMRRLAQATPGRPVLIVADEESVLKHLTRAMDICRNVGLDKIRLQSR